MKLGVTIMATDLAMPPGDAAREAEARGFSSFYVPEHTHIPVSRLTPPPTGDEELENDYRRTLDPYIALAMAAEATRNIMLGTGVSLILQHHPITLAKSIATLDRLSGGRFVLGAGYGWNREEMEHHNIDYGRRRGMLREWLLAMYALWENEEGEFSGEFVDFSPSWSWPKPLARENKKRRPKVLIGGAGGKRTFRDIAELADGWIPIGGAGVKEQLPQLKKALEAAGRDISELDIVPFGVIPSTEKLEYYESIGITEAVLRLPSAGKKEVLEALDELAAFI